MTIERQTKQNTSEAEKPSEAVVQTPLEDDDFPLGPACDLSNEGGCESCQ